MTTSDASGSKEPGEFCFRSMSQSDAEAIAAWRYPGEYSFYDRSDPDDLAELLDPLARADQYFAVDSKARSLIGFFQYKCPHGTSLEIGLGLHPSWTGQGLGESFLEAGLDYASRRFSPEQFTLSVVSFNRRAITVYERAGFETVRVFNHRTNGREWEFIEMRRPALRIWAQATLPNTRPDESPRRDHGVAVVPDYRDPGRDARADESPRRDYRTAKVPEKRGAASDSVEQRRRRA